MNRQSVIRISGVMLLGIALLTGVFVQGTSTASAAETINLKFATLFPKQDPMCYGPQYLFRELEKRTGGQVKVTEFYSQSLGKAPEMLDMLDKGIADIAVFPIAIFPRVFQMSSVMSMPGLISKRAVAGEVMYELGYRGLLDKDFADYKALMWEGTEAMGFGFVDKKVTSLEDLKKLKVRAPGGQQSAILKALGPSVVTIPTPDIYMALDRGVADGLTTMPGWYLTMKMYEVTKYWLWKPMGIGANLTVMSKKKWNSLPADVRAEISDILPAAKHHFLQRITEQIPDAKAHLRSKGVEVYSLDPKEEARWDAILDEYTQSWIADMEAKGYPAKEAVQATKDIVKRFD